MMMTPTLTLIPMPEGRFLQKLALAALIATSCVRVAWAADAPDAAAVLKLERDQIERALQERRLQQGTVTPQIDMLPAPTRPAASQVANIFLKRFEVGVSEILTAEEIRAVLQPFEGRLVSLSELFDAVDGINALYVAKRMPTARAFLAPQEILDGVVSVQLVEARVGAITVDGHRRLKSAFINERLALKGGDLMSVPVLEQDLIRFNRLHGTQLRASVKPGADFGTTDVLLTAVEPPQYQNSFFVDNAGRYTVGEHRLGVMSHVNGLLGLDDELALSVTGASGSKSYSLGYAWPVNTRDLMADVSLSKGSIDVVEGAFVPLDIAGASQEISVGLSQPLLIDSERLWKVYGRLTNKNSTSYFGGLPQQEVRVNALTLGVSGQRQSQEGAWSMDVNVNHGNQSAAGQGDFFVLRANGAWLRNIGAHSQLVIRSGLQYSGADLLPSSEQFQLGGSNSVRGYSEGLLSGRQGYLLSAEFRHDIALPASVVESALGASRAMVLAFLDHGGAFPFRPAGQEQTTSDDYLTSVGAGLQLDWGARANLRLVLGFPQTTNSNEVKYHNPRLHAVFMVNWP